MTLTTFFRKDAIYIKPEVYDYGIFLNASRLGYGYFSQNRTSNYSINPISNNGTNIHPEARLQSISPLLHIQSE